MKKLSVLLALLVSTVSFAEKERENSIDLGLGVFYRNSVYKEKDNDEVILGLNYAFNHLNPLIREFNNKK